MSKESDRINAKHGDLRKAREEPERLLKEMRIELQSHLESAALLAGILRTEATNESEGKKFEATQTHISNAITTAAFPQKRGGPDDR